MSNQNSNGSSKSGNKPVALDVPAAPASTAPDVPANYKKLDKSQTSSLRKPTAQQASSTGAVATEVGGSTTFEDDFGKKAPKLGTSFKTAAAWKAESERARLWADYSEDMSHLAHDKALSDHENFKTDYAAGLRHDPSIAVRYPVLTSFTTARSLASRRGAVTRKKNLALAATDDTAEPTEAQAPATTTTAASK